MSNIGLVIERRENRIPQFKGIQAHGVPSALEPGFTTQAVTHQNYLHSGFFATPAGFSCINNMYQCRYKPCCSE